MPNEFGLVIIGASTGGPQALEVLLKGLPRVLQQPVVIVQHMPGGHTASLARRLNQLCPLSVTEAREGARLVRGEVVIAPGGVHLVLKKKAWDLICTLDHGPRLHAVRPAIDVTMRSVAKTSRKVLSIILTGLGHDGSDGAKALSERGGYCIAQSRASSMVSSMPMTAVQRGVADEVLALPRIAGRIQELCGGRAGVLQ